MVENAEKTEAVEPSLKNRIEAVLMASPNPLSIRKLVAILADEEHPVSEGAVRRELGKLRADYQQRGVQLRELASGFRFQVAEEHSHWVGRLLEERPPRYSRALLETLAIIAWRQPVTRAEIEEIRGVAVNSSIIRTLREREWIKVVGRRELPGRPELLATTRYFLDHFNLEKLTELPAIAELRKQQEEEEATREKAADADADAKNADGKSADETVADGQVVALSLAGATGEEEVAGDDGQAAAGDDRRGAGQKVAAAEETEVEAGREAGEGAEIGEAIPLGIVGGDGSPDPVLHALDEAMARADRLVEEVSADGPKNSQGQGAMDSSG